MARSPQSRSEPRSEPREEPPETDQPEWEGLEPEGESPAPPAVPTGQRVPQPPPPQPGRVQPGGVISTRNGVPPS